MNALLPEDIVVRRVYPVTAEFHARYSARSRLYRYAIYNRALRSPFCSRFAHHVAAPLDVEKMNRAAQCIVGAHDFAAFGRSPSEGHTVRRVYRAEWTRNGDWVFFEIEANAFLRHMVRSLVGTFILIGSGKMLPEGMGRILTSMDRNAAGPTAPPQGLCLERVTYQEPWQEIGRSESYQVGWISCLKPRS